MVLRKPRTLSGPSQSALLTRGRGQGHRDIYLGMFLGSPNTSAKIYSSLALESTISEDE